MMENMEKERQERERKELIEKERFEQQQRNEQEQAFKAQQRRTPDQYAEAMGSIKEDEEGENLQAKSSKGIVEQLPSRPLLTDYTNGEDSSQV